MPLFGRKKITIDSIRVPQPDWELAKSDKSIRAWANQEEAISLSVNFFPMVPDLPSTNIDLLRTFYRDSISPHNGGLIQVDWVEVAGKKGVKTIFKFPQEPSGMTYLGSLTFPFAKHSFVVKTQAFEIGSTGLRDAMVGNSFMQKLMKEGIAVEEGMKDWNFDPYDPTIKEGNLMNHSEKEGHDFMHPNHPLSRVRRLLEDLEKGITFDPAVDKLPPFSA